MGGSNRGFLGYQQDVPVPSFTEAFEGRGASLKLGDVNEDKWIRGAVRDLGVSSHSSVLGDVAIPGAHHHV